MSAVRDLRLARTALVMLAISSAAVGIPASFAPRGFYDGFPFVTSWVDKLGPFNEHLVTDTGGLFLAFALLFAWAARRPHPALVRPLCAAFAVSQLLHFVFHVRHLDGFGVADAIGEVLSLALLLVLPAVAVWALPSERGAEGRA
ncbi:hypothetical protein [Patulibacter defluvii]|uniref:hypothetical protein n=1 Tax=Patulibacter defluvii TaxID=3095358 RepID=UPI002A763998|nr:hypothetical protein [Patulibacter sp. DM4]